MACFSTTITSNEIVSCFMETPESDWSANACCQKLITERAGVAERARGPEIIVLRGRVVNDGLENYDMKAGY